METVRHKPVNRVATVQRPAASLKTVQRQTITGKGTGLVQKAMKVSSPHDPAEKEAESTAKQIMRMAVPETSIAYIKTGDGGVFRQINPQEKKEEKDKKLRPRLQSPYISRFANSGVLTQATKKKEDEKIQRQAEGQRRGVDPNVSTDLQSSMASGAPLPFGVRRLMEPRFRADFSKVKIHTGDQAVKLNRQVNAQAFTTGSHIFFGKDKFKPENPEGQELIAHELTHTIQQGAAIQKGTAISSEGTIQRREEVKVTQQVPVQVQRLGISDALDFFAREANLIPGFRMFTIILGVNPINMSSVPRDAANILRAVVEFMPLGGLITKALDNLGIFEKVGAFVEQQIKSLGLVGSVIKQALTEFISKLKWSDIFDLGGVWTRAKRIFTEPIDKLISFAKGLLTGIVALIKDAILRPLAKLAEGTQGYGLLKMVLGQDPITGDPVPFDGNVLIGSFMKLIGQEEIWNNLKHANAVPRAVAWFKGAVGTLVGLVREVPKLFMQALKSLELIDLIPPPVAFIKVALVFSNFINRFISWAGNAAWNLLEIIFEVVSPAVLGYLKKTGTAFKNILKNPLPFVGNLVKAAKLSFQNFAANIGTHLKTGLIDWLTGALSGVYIPKSFSLGEMVKFVFSLLGILWQNVRQKLVKVVGEPVVSVMETGFDIVVTLVTQGPAAAWDKIQEHLTNLKEMVISGITSFVVEMVITKAVPKLIAMFIPGAGFISAILSIYDTIMVFVNKISKIAQVVTGFINSIAEIAAGAIGAAVTRVEGILVNLLSLAINFFAGFVGLGKVSDKIMGVINKVRVSIDKALDALIKWIVTMAKKLFSKVFGKKDKKPDERSQEQKKIDLSKGIAEAQKFLEDKKNSSDEVQKKLPGIKSKYRITVLELVIDSKSEEKETNHIHGEIHSQPVINDGNKVNKDTEIGSVIIKVISTKQPRSSLILISKIPKLQTQTSPAHFELSTTKAIAQVTGLPVETQARFLVKEEKDEKTGKITIVRRRIPLGFIEAPSGLILPIAPRLFGSLSGDPRKGGQRDKEEPQIEVRGGDLRKRGMIRHPDALLVTPSQIEPLEFTLDVSMSMREKPSAEPHKLMQIPGTIENILRNFSREIPIVYTIFVHGTVPQERVAQLEAELKKFKGSDVTVNFVRR